jgi:multidrug efflux pump subunit AcrA (membrane-fusion protein)
MKPIQDAKPAYVKGKIRFRALTALTASAIVMAMLAGCAAPQTPGADQAAAAADGKAVKTAKVTKQKIADPPEVIADVQPSLALDVVLKADGEVLELKKQRGETVHKGDVILVVDNTDALSQAQKAQLAVTSAEAQLTKSQQDLDNGKADLQSSIDKLSRQLNDTQRQYNKLHNDYDAGLVSKNDLDNAKTGLTNMQQDLNVLKDKYNTLVNTDSLAPLRVQLDTAKLTANDAQKNLEYYQVEAPADGILTELTPQVGMTVSRGMKIGKVEQVDPVKIVTSLTGTARQLVNNKQELSYHLSGVSDLSKAKISFLADVVNSQSNAYDLELQVPNQDGKLKPGMKVQVRLTDEADQDVVAIPTTSIVREAADTFVFVLNGDTAEKRKVTLGRLKDANQEVLSGLKEGETLIVSGQQQLKDQEKVEVQAAGGAS